MKVPFTWKVTGWFMIGWSAEFTTGEARPLRYFGEDLVAYRDDSGELHLLSGHCRHLGAHIGHGGKVVGDCVECPFHGWRWGPDGTNRYIPYQPDRPNRALRLRVYPVREQYGCVFMWHQPDGKEPQWELPDLFHKFPQFDTVSVYVAITNLVMDAVNAGYRVVLPRDAVAGIPTEYATAIIDNTLSLLATVTTTDELLGVWKQS